MVFKQRVNIYSPRADNCVQTADPLVKPLLLGQSSAYLCSLHMHTSNTCTCATYVITAMQHVQRPQTCTHMFVELVFFYMQQLSLRMRWDWIRSLNLELFTNLYTNICVMADCSAALQRHRMHVDSTSNFYTENNQRTGQAILRITDRIHVVCGKLLTTCSDVI